MFAVDRIRSLGQEEQTEMFTELLLKDREDDVCHCYVPKAAEYFCLFTPQLSRAVPSIPSIWERIYHFPL